MVKIPEGASVTYQLQYRRCGKMHCHCAQTVGAGRQDPRAHGPYWYAYWREGGKLRSGYVGKDQPAGEAAERAARNAAWRGIVAAARESCATSAPPAQLHKQRRPHQPSTAA